MEDLSTPAFTDTSLDNVARPVDLIRLTAALDELEIIYEIDEDLHDTVIIHFASHMVFVSVTGPLSPSVYFDAYVRAGIPPELEADLVESMARWHRTQMLPRVFYETNDHGRLRIRMDHTVPTRAGLSDVQLRQHIDWVCGACQGAVEALARDVPQVAGIPEGVTESFGERDTPFMAPVTPARIQPILEYLEVDDLEFDAETNMFSYTRHGLQSRVFLTRDGEVMVIRTFSGVYGPEWCRTHLNLLANKMNRWFGLTTATLQTVDTWHFLYLESHVPVGLGMTAAQLYAAIRDMLDEQTAGPRRFADDIAELKSTTQVRALESGPDQERELNLDDYEEDDEAEDVGEDEDEWEDFPDE